MCRVGQDLDFSRVHQRVSPFLQASAGDSGSPARTHGASSLWFHRGGLKSTEWSLPQRSSRHDLAVHALDLQFWFITGKDPAMVRLAQPGTGSSRLHLRDQAVKVCEFRTEKESKFSSAAGSQDAADSHDPSPRDKQDFSKPFLLNSLRVQIGPLKNRHIRLENHQPLRIRHLLQPEPSVH